MAVVDSAAILPFARWIREARTKMSLVSGLVEFAVSANETGQAGMHCK